MFREVKWTAPSHTPVAVQEFQPQYICLWIQCFFCYLQWFSLSCAQSLKTSCLYPITQEVSEDPWRVSPQGSSQGDCPGKLSCLLCSLPLSGSWLRKWAQKPQKPAGPGRPYSPSPDHCVVRYPRWLLQSYREQGGRNPSQMDKRRKGCWGMN